jgi:hypothetical protein
VGLHPASQLKLRTIPPPARADTFKNDLLLSFVFIVVMGRRLEFLRGSFYGSFDSGISSASADIAIHGIINILVGRIRILLEQSGSRHNLTGLAVATLRDIVFKPCLLYGMIAGLGEALNSSYFGIRHCRDRKLTGSYSVAVQMNGAGPALRDPAPEFGAY